MAIVNTNGSQNGAVTAQQQADLDAAKRAIATLGGGVKGVNNIQTQGSAIIQHDNNVGSIDDSNYLYGGQVGGAAQAANYYQGAAAGALQRQGVNIDYSQADQSRGNALSMADLMAKRARGETPSIAGMVGDRSTGQLAAEQSSAAASARGPAALALAQQGAAANTAQGTANIAGQTQINAATERLQAEQAAQGAYSGMTAQDAQRAQSQANMTAQQRALNDAFYNSNSDRAVGINSTQLTADMNKQAQASGNALNMEGVVANRRAVNKASDAATFGAIANVAGAAVPVVGSAAAKGATAAGTAASKPDPLPDQGEYSGSDERMKEPVGPTQSTWGNSVELAPVPADAPSTWGGGPGTSGVDVQKQIAHQALADQALREQAAATGPGPMAVDGIGALKRRDAEDLALMRYKDRNGAGLSKREQSTRGGLEYREELMLRKQRKEAQAAPGPAGTQASNFARALTGGSREEKSSPVGGLLGGIGKALAPAAAAPAGYQPRYVQPTMLPLPSHTLSDDKTKLAAAWDAGHATGIANVEKVARMTPAEIAARSEGDDYVPEAAAVRGIKAHAWDEGNAEARAAASGAHAKGFHEAREAMFTPYKPAPPIAPEDVDPHDVFQRSNAAPRLAGASRGGEAAPSVMRKVSTPDADAPEPPIAPAYDPGPAPAPSIMSYAMRARGMMSDERTKHVGTLGPQMDHADMAEAAHSLRAVPYTYKPEFAQAEGQAPGEVNVGPVAQEMQKSRVAATAVKEDPATGMREIDIPKYTKVIGGIVADQQDQLDEMRSLLARRLGGARGRR